MGIEKTAEDTELLLLQCKQLKTYSLFMAFEISWKRRTFLSASKSQRPLLAKARYHSTIRKCRLMLIKCLFHIYKRLVGLLYRSMKNRCVYFDSFLICVYLNYGHKIDHLNAYGVAGKAESRERV